MIMQRHVFLAVVSVRLCSRRRTRNRQLCALESISMECSECVDNSWAWSLSGRQTDTDNLVSYKQSSSTTELPNWLCCCFCFRHRHHRCSAEPHWVVVRLCTGKSHMCSQDGPQNPNEPGNRPAGTSTDFTQLQRNASPGGNVSKVAWKTIRSHGF